MRWICYIILFASTVNSVVTYANWLHQGLTKATTLLISISWFGTCMVARQCLAQRIVPKMLEFQNKNVRFQTINELTVIIYTYDDTCAFYITSLKIIQF